MCHNRLSLISDIVFVTIHSNFCNVFVTLCCNHYKFVIITNFNRVLTKLKNCDCGMTYAQQIKIKFLIKL